MTKYTATAPDGTVFTRGTKNTYSHAILLRVTVGRARAKATDALAITTVWIANGDDSDRYAARIAEANETLARTADLDENATAHWGEIGFSSRPDLAEATARKWAAQFGAENVLVVPID